MSHPWWHDAIIYHVYVRSFQDSNGDGIGDLPGLASRLDVIEALGIDAVWLSPVSPSPDADFGYDVADYLDVDPRYGTLGDLAALRDDLHARGIRLILDFVPNHTSDQHAWFRESAASRSSPRRAWYVWRDPAPDGGPPNNWVSIFGGPAWTLDETTGQYYLHSFLQGQPDLDWGNPEVVEAMHAVLRHWLDWGADGFRVDAVHQVAKDPALRSNPPDPAYRVALGDPGYDPFRAQLHLHDTMQPEEVYEVVRGLRRVIDEFEDRLLVGETPVFDWDHYAGFLGDGSDLFHLAFNFHPMRARSLEQIRAGMEGMYAALDEGAWPTLVLSNHDFDRHITRLSPDSGAHDPLAKAAAAALLLGRGTPFVYFGEEIGLPNGRIPPELLCDPVGLFERDAGHRIHFSAGYESFGRDPERTPMPWTDGEHGGFTTRTPWLPVHGRERCVAIQRQDPASVWHWYRSLAALRRQHVCLRRGAYAVFDAGDGVWAFVRSFEGAVLLVAINTEPRPTTCTVSAGQVLLGSARAAGSRLDGETELQPFEVVVVKPDLF
jgi:alpha-glucosidase